MARYVLSGIVLSYKLKVPIETLITAQSTQEMRQKVYSLEIYQK